jgi:hypothetical protein
MRRMLIVCCALQTGCAAAARVSLEDLVEVRPPKPPVETRVEQAPEHERILGSFAISPDPVVLLTPPMLEAHFDATHGDDGFADLVERFRAIGVPEKEAAALLDWGAVLWFLGRPADAYAKMMEAHRLYAELGELEGLAHANEWLGYFLRSSEAIAEAGEHFALAYQMFAALGDQSSCSRLLAYAR